MSKPSNKWFTHSDDSDSDDESDASEMSMESGDEAQQQQGRGIPNRFLGSDDDESSEESEGGRVAKSTAERRMQELENSVEKIEDNIALESWKTVLSEFETLNKVLQKTMKVEGISETPPKYISCIVQIEQAAEELFQDKKAQKKMRGDEKRALRKLRTQIQKNNKKYQDQIKKFLEDPEAFLGEDDEEEEEEEEEAPAFTFEVDQEDISDEGESEEEWDEDEDEFENEEVAESEEEDEEEEKEKKEKTKEIEDNKKPGKQPSTEHIEIKEETVEERLADIIFQRGKKGTDPRKQVAKLEALLEDCETTKQRIQASVTMVAALFDTVKSTGVMDINSWRMAYHYLNDTMKLIRDNPHLQVSEAQDEVVVESEHDSAIKDQDEEDNYVKLIGNFTVFVQRLHTEFMHSLQQINPRNPEYVSRMEDQALFMDIAEKVFLYYQKRKAAPQQARIANLIIEHLYYRRQEDHKKMFEKKVDIVDDVKEEKVVGSDLLQVMQQLSTLIFEHGDKRAKNRTMLCLIYHHALHDRFEKASNLLRMSHLQDGIGFADVLTQILFNRTMAQLGMSAFRCGRFRDAHSCLTELCSSNRYRDLLAQSITRDFYQSEQLIEGKRMLPYYMHINLENLDTMHYLSALFLEVPNMAKHPYDYKRHVISKAFRRIWDFYEKQPFSGEPETVREHIHAIALAIQKGNWREGFDLVQGIKAWNLVPNHEHVLELVKQELKVTALKTYILSYSKYYKTIQGDTLAKMFDLELNTVHSITSKMIVNNDIAAAWDQSTNSLDILASPTKLQSLGLIFAERQTIMSDFNEKIFEFKTGTNITQQKKGRDFHHRTQTSRKTRRDDGKRSKVAKSM